MNDFRFGNPALAAFIADMYEPMRKPMRTQVTRAPQAPGRLDLDKRETAALKAPAAPVKTYACEACEDTGETMQPVCYGGPVFERMGECLDCKPKVKGKMKPIEPPISRIDGEVYEIEFTGAATGTLVRRFARWVTQGWCSAFETAEAARDHSLSYASYLNGKSSPTGHVANVKVLRHIPKEN